MDDVVIGLCKGVRKILAALSVEVESLGPRERPVVVMARMSRVGNIPAHQRLGIEAALLRDPAGLRRALRG